MEIHSLGVYPMYHTEKDCVFNPDQGRLLSCEITCSHISKINVGDVYYHKNSHNDMKVSEILEERPAKGNHPTPATFYRLKLKRA